MANLKNASGKALFLIFLNEAYSRGGIIGKGGL